MQRRFLTLNAEIGEESKIHFVFCTSAPKNRINAKQLEEKFRKQFTDSASIEVSILIDDKNNYLAYGDGAIIVNASAFSIKQLYAEHSINLLSLNLRYHVAETKRDGVDRGIRETIDKDREMFWLKNNGLTIICDDFIPLESCRFFCAVETSKLS